MSETVDKQRAKLVPTKDRRLAAEAIRGLMSSRTGPLVVRLADGKEFAMPSAVEPLLTRVLAELAEGNNVSVVTLHEELTTQEAADLLNVSRPFVVGLLEEGKIPFRMVGTHRRIRAMDVEAFKASVESRRLETLDELARQAQELKLGY